MKGCLRGERTIVVILSGSEGPLIQQARSAPRSFAAAQDDKDKLQ
jgi:hypothetical protein